MNSRMPTEHSVSCLERLAVPKSVLFDSDNICLLCWINYYKCTMSISNPRNKHSPDSCMRTSVLKRVLNGNFHHKQVIKMNSIALETLVMRLLEYPSVKAGTKTSLVFNQEQPITYSSGVLSVKSTKNAATGNKVVRDNLIQFVLSCCDYFRSYKETWLPSARPWRINDENFDAIGGGRGVKRKSYMLLNNTDNKKRKTLFSVNDRVLKVPLVDHNLEKLSEVHTEKQPVLNQSDFLGLLNLGHNNNLIPAKSQVPNFSRLVKLNNCPQIPLSSDIGKVMIQRENCNVPDYVTTRKLERTEWYTNRTVPKCSEYTFEVSYVPSKNNSDHVYKFPVRQYQQLYNDRHCTELLLRMCKPLRIVVNKMEFVRKRKELEVNQLSVIVPKLSINQLKKHLCKNIQIVIEKQPVTATRFSRRLSVYQKKC